MLFKLKIKGQVGAGEDGRRKARMGTGRESVQAEEEEPAKARGPKGV